MENAAGVACLDGGSTPPGSTTLCITCDSFLIAGEGFRRKLAPTEPHDPCVPKAVFSRVLLNRAVFPHGSIHGADGVPKIPRLQMLIWRTPVMHHRVSGGLWQY